MISKFLRSASPLTGLAFLIFFPLAFFRAALFAVLGMFHGDELRGVGEVCELTWGKLLYAGPYGELNPSPLHYVFDKAWIAAAGGSPQLAWDLRFFFRVLPITWFCLAVFAVFLCARGFLQTRNLPRPLAWLLGAALALFFYGKGYLIFYAAQNRPYSLWLFLSILQLVLFASSFRADCVKNRKMQAAYFLVTILITFTTYVAGLQIALSAAAYFLFPPKGAGKREKSFHLVCVLCSAAIAFWYFRATPTGFSEAAMNDLFSSVLDLLVVSARLDQYGGAFGLTLSSNWQDAGWVLRAWCMAVLVIPILRWRFQAMRGILVYAYGLLISSLAITLVMTWKGATIGGSRYFIFLVPAFTALFWTTLLELAETMSRISKKWIPERIFYSACAAVLSVYLLWSSLDRQQYELRTTLIREPYVLSYLQKKEIPRPECPAKLDAFPGGAGNLLLEKFRDLCR